MHDDPVPGADIVVPGVGLGIFLPVIGPAGGPPVTDHLRYVAQGHPAAEGPVRSPGGKIDPVLEVVPVPALVVEPGPGTAKELPLHGIGRTVALVIADGGDEFRRGELGEIMEDPLSVQTQPEAALRHVFFMGQHGAQMSEEALRQCFLLKCVGFHAVNDSTILRKKHEKLPAGSGIQRTV